MLSSLPTPRLLCAMHMRVLYASRLAWPGSPFLDCLPDWVGGKLVKEIDSGKPPLLPCATLVLFFFSLYSLPLQSSTAQRRPPIANATGLCYPREKLSIVQQDAANPE